MRKETVHCVALTEVTSRVAVRQIIMDGIIGQCGTQCVIYAILYDPGNMADKW